MTPKGKSLYVFLAFAVLFAGLLFIYYEKRPEVSPVAHGEVLTVQAGCYACHGVSELDKRANFRLNSSGKYRPKSVPSFWENGIEEAAVLKEWVRDGSTEDERERHKRYFMQMPAYGEGALDEAEIDAIAAWILAEGIHLSQGMGNAEEDMPLITSDEVAKLSEEQLFVLGDRLSRQQACYHCHGEFGQGGIGNLESFKGYIPGFWGNDFLELTDGGSRDEILHWIDNGRGIAIESGIKGVLSKKYFESQAIPMPAYADMLTDGEKTLLVEFSLLLNRKGPLASEDLESIGKVLLEAVNKEQN